MDRNRQVLVGEFRHFTIGADSDGIYVQFSYKEFLVDQCVNANQRNSVKGTSVEEIKVESVVFDGTELDSNKWGREIFVVKSSPKASSRSVSENSSETVPLMVSEENFDSVNYYFRCLSEDLLSNSKAVITEVMDGCYSVSNEGVDYHVEYEGSAIRGSFGKWLKKKVSKAVAYVKENPVAVISYIAVATTVAVQAASGVGLITLPACLTVEEGSVILSISLPLGL